MHTTNLRKVGGSVMLAVPPAILDQLGLKPGATVGLAVEGNRLILQPQPRPRYTLDELLAKCNPADAATEISEEDRIWLNLPPAGREL
jgi:antitoxin ChpS